MVASAMRPVRPRNIRSGNPMFGPDTQLLSGRHVIFVDLGSAEALERARELFAPTMAEQVVMSLDDHDRLIAYVLGLSHALNIAFFTAPAVERRSGASAGEAREHDVRLAARRRDTRRAGEPRSVFRDPESERLRLGVAGSAGEGGGTHLNRDPVTGSRSVRCPDETRAGLSRRPSERDRTSRLTT